ncbi:MAG TPA: methyltransferase domain-containing protein [bacterium]|nr:methyltransferase domain-containing protein [bacterium]
MGPKNGRNRFEPCEKRRDIEVVFDTTVRVMELYRVEEESSNMELQRTLVFIPTYNEREHVEKICEGIQDLNLGCDILFIDDHSPDGTGDLLEQLSSRYGNVAVKHRFGKLGIGSAHLDGIAYAYDHEYEILITMDCDFTHSPEDIPRFLASSEDCDLVVGSRFLQAGSLADWNLYRRGLTILGHFMTRRLLGLPGDASGAFRLYRLNRIPRSVFDLVTSRGYSFFFETMFLLKANGASIGEVPIILPRRTYGHSKMTLHEVLHSASYIFQLSLMSYATPERFLCRRVSVQLNPSLVDPQNWDAYWDGHTESSVSVYTIIAGFYRRLVIKRNLHRFIRDTFPSGSRLLHAGCGSGQVDGNLHRDMRITAVDISPKALDLYSRNNPDASRIQHASLFDLPFPDSTFDGIYNLGVMEHFTSNEVSRIFQECHRVLKPSGKILLFWPHRRASSVLVLKFVHFFLHKILNRNTKLHPDEISLLSSRAEADRILQEAGLVLFDYHFGIRDLFVQAVLIAGRPDSNAQSSLIHSGDPSERNGDA